jgi:rod shape-determining protein MreB
MRSKKTGKSNLIVGVDLGTSRSAIPANNRKKRWVDSYVGWPKDFIAKKVVGKSILFGEEALANRLSLELSRPLAYGVIKEGVERDEEAVHALFKHLISLIGADKRSKVRAVVGVPAEALKANKIAIKKVFSNYTEALMVVSEPFAVAYGLEALNNAMVIDIGAGTIDFCIMHGTVPADEDQRSIVTAGDYVDEQMFSAIKARYPDADFNIEMVRQIKEKFSFVGEPEDPVEINLPVASKQTLHDVTDEIKIACESILPAIVETAQELIANFDPQFQDEIRKNIILAGGGSQIRGLCSYLQKVLIEDGPAGVQRVEDPLFAGADGALALAKDMPKEYWSEE